MSPSIFPWTARCTRDDDDDDARAFISAWSKTFGTAKRFVFDPVGTRRRLYEMYVPCFGNLSVDLRDARHVYPSSYDVRDVNPSSACGSRPESPAEFDSNYAVNFASNWPNDIRKGSAFLFGVRRSRERRETLFRYPIAIASRGVRSRTMFFRTRGVYESSFEMFRIEGRGVKGWSIVWKL